MASLFSPSHWAREVHVIGAGGIGSWLGLRLITSGVPIVHFYDDDVVEAHNIGPQFYWPEDLGKPKVEVLASFARHMHSATTIVPHITRINPISDVQFRGVVMSGVDSMRSRNDIWSHLKYNHEVELYMDGRIGGDTFQLYTLNPSLPSQVRCYESWLFPDEVASDELCSIRDDANAAIALNALMLNNLTSFARGERPADILHGDLATVAPLGSSTAVVRIP